MNLHHIIATPLPNRCVGTAITGQPCSSPICHATPDPDYPEYGIDANSHHSCFNDDDRIDIYYCECCTYFADYYFPHNSIDLNTFICNDCKDGIHHERKP